MNACAPELDARPESLTASALPVAGYAGGHVGTRLMFQVFSGINAQFKL